jgi:3-deoxy-manno-octulosonate cytidylyltransferase (CMP-KDO synthetase)
MLHRFTAIIPARLGSTRLPRKVLADIQGQPMIVRVAQIAHRAGFSQVVVATDSEEVIEACNQANIRALLTPDCATGTDRVVWCANALDLPSQDWVINVQGDEPLISPHVLSETARALAHSPHPCATPLGIIRQLSEVMNPNIVKCTRRHDGLAMSFSRAPIPWARGSFPHEKVLPEGYLAYRHYGVYAFRVDFLRQFPQLPASPLEAVELLEQLRILQAGHSMLTVVVKGDPEPAVDTPDDLAKVRERFLALNG